MQKVSKWEIFELTLYTERTLDNPFLDVSFGAAFTLGAQSCAVDGFYDGTDENGRHVFKARFAPMREGVWRYETHSCLPELSGKAGEFACAEAVSRGGLTIDPNFANYFARADGSYQLILNEGWYPHPGNGKQHNFEDVDYQQPSESDMRMYYDILATHGLNFLVDIGQLYARQSTVTDTSFRWPWKVLDAGKNQFDRDRFNLDYYRRTERMLQFAKEREIFFAMELLYDNSIVRPREWSFHPVNKDNGGWLDTKNGIGWEPMFDIRNRVHMDYTERYVRYTVARLSAYWNLCWSVGSENGNLVRINDHRLPHAFIPAEQCAEWYNYWGAYLARTDVYARPRSFGDAGKQPLMVTNAYNGFIITQDPRNYPKDDVKHYYSAMNAFGEEFWNYGRPVIIGEMTAGTNNHYDMERRLYWIAFTSGYNMGRADRHFCPVSGGKLVEIEKFDTDGTPPIYADIARMKKFVQEQNVKFWRMRPCDHLIETVESQIYCYAAEGEEYVLYYVNGGTATLDIPAARVRWYNPRTGETGGEACREKGRMDFTAPDGDDWVLHIVAK